MLQEPPAPDRKIIVSSSEPYLIILGLPKRFLQIDSKHLKKKKSEKIVIKKGSPLSDFDQIER